MKKIFPIITVLISLSLLGLIFFQFLWIKSARDAKNKQVEENIIRSLNDAGERLTEDKGSLVTLPKRNELIFPGDHIQLQPLKPSVSQRQKFRSACRYLVCREP